jgi:cellulose biosynthesis protein BcsE
MNAGGTYALVLDAAPVKTSLMIGSLRAALTEAIPCLLLLSSAHDVSSPHALTLWGADLIQATQNEALRVFVHEQEFKSNLFRFGINRFIQDLELLKPPNKSYIWVDHAEELFALQDMQFATKQLKILKSWLQARQITATFVFAKLNATETHDIHLLSEELSGLCRIAGGSNGLEAKFLHWQSPDGAISHRNYGLAETATGFYRATRSAQTPGGLEGGAVGVDGQASRDETPLFINLDPSVQASLESTETNWQFLDSPLSLFHAVRGSITATIVLRFGQDTEIRQLAETVHTLRTVVGRGAKIIVHEDEFSLRFSYESLLLRLGANFIMHRDVPLWRLSRVIDSLDGTQFDRPVDVDFSVLMSGAFPSKRSGLVPVDDLVYEIESILSKTKLNNVPIAFFIGIFATARDAQDVLDTFDMTREGDLFAIEDQIIYIFLSACPPSHVIETIERKLKGSLSTTFSTTSTSTQTTDIVQQLRELKLHLGIESTKPEIATSQPEYDFAQEARPPLKRDGIVSRSPFSFEPVGATNLPTNSRSRQVESRFSEPAARRAPPTQDIEITRPVESSSQEIPSRVKPLVFTRIRSANDTET